MGSGYIYHCKKCNKKHQTFLGYGMMFPKIYKELIDGIYKGDFGEEMQKLIKSKPNLAINANKEIYLCRHCNNWNIEFILDIYEPTTKLKEVPEYVTEYDLKSNYKLVKKHIHKCPECGKRTRKLNDNETNCLPCPNCKTQMTISGFIDWD